MFFAERPDVFPAKTRGNRQIGAQAEFILAEKAEIIIEGEALRVAGISQGKNIANVEVCQPVDDAIIRKRRARPVALRYAGIYVKQSALQVIVEALHVVAVIFAAELDRVVPLNPGEIVQNLKRFAHPSAWHAEPGRAQILQVAVEINFR